MNLQQLYYFRSIAQLEHFTKASEKLSVSQSSLSHAIKELERELNVELFSRSGRNVILTQYGRLLLPYVEKALTSLEEGSAIIRDAADPNTGTVSVAFLPSLSTFVPCLFAQYCAETNRFGVHIQTEQGNEHSISDDLCNGKTDLAFSTWINDSSIDGVPIGEHELVLLVNCNHRFASRETIYLKELNEERFIAFNSNCQIRHQTDEIFMQFQVYPKITMETSQELFMYGLISANQGVSIMPKPLGISLHNIKIIRIQDGLITQPLYMLWNKNRLLSSATRDFRDYVKKNGLVFSLFSQKDSFL